MLDTDDIEDSWNDIGNKMIEAAKGITDGLMLSVCFARRKMKATTENAIK